MDKNILRYEVRPGDTLGKVAAAPGMTAGGLKDFHNRHCSTENRLRFDNLAGITQVIIPCPSGDPEALHKSTEFIFTCLTRDSFSHCFSVGETFSGPSGTRLEIEYRADIRSKELAEGNTI